MFLHGVKQNTLAGLSMMIWTLVGIRIFLMQLISFAMTWGISMVLIFTKRIVAQPTLEIVMIALGKNSGPGGLQDQEVSGRIF
ncbi:hypothetical protein ES703_101120 [subsurface metagenome]